ncbi:MAG: hypothetical protein KDA53_12640 [Hyphomonas sp.]|nr:hypothetical protein [Hyphomonas sp.]
MNRREQIEAARHFTWKGRKVEATAELYCLLLDADRRLRLGVTAESIEVPVPIAGKLEVVTLTEVEDLLDQIREAFTDLAQARGAA